jgi:DNA-binding winged helix-turn-helix (wHTH) protein
MKLRFGPFELVSSERALRRGGMVLPLGSRALDILVYLANRPGQVITKKELIDRVWSDVFVEEGTLRVHMASIRKVLGDDGHSFVGAVVQLEDSTVSRGASIAGHF